MPIVRVDAPLRTEDTPERTHALDFRLLDGWVKSFRWDCSHVLHVPLHAGSVSSAPCAEHAHRQPASGQGGWLAQAVSCWSFGVAADSGGSEPRFRAWASTDSPSPVKTQSLCGKGHCSRAIHSARVFFCQFQRPLKTRCRPDQSASKGSRRPSPPIPVGHAREGKSPRDLPRVPLHRLRVDHAASGFEVTSTPCRSTVNGRSRREGPWRGTAARTRQVVQHCFGRPSHRRHFARR